MKEFIAGLVLTLVIGGIGIAIEMQEREEKIYITNPATGIRNGNTWMAGVACGVELLALVKKSK